MNSIFLSVSLFVVNLTSFQACFLGHLIFSRIYIPHCISWQMRTLSWTFWWVLIKYYHTISSVAQSYLTLCDPWTAARQASLSITNSRSLLKLMSIESVMPSSHPSSVVPFSHLQSFPASGSFQVSQSFTSGGQSITPTEHDFVLNWPRVRQPHTVYCFPISSLSSREWN